MTLSVNARKMRVEEHLGNEDVQWTKMWMCEIEHSRHHEKENIFLMLLEYRLKEEK